MEPVDPTVGPPMLLIGLAFVIGLIIVHWVKG